MHEILEICRAYLHILIIQATNQMAKNMHCYITHHYFDFLHEYLIIMVRAQSAKQIVGDMDQEILCGEGKSIGKSIWQIVTGWNFGQELSKGRISLSSAYKTSTEASTQNI